MFRLANKVKCKIMMLQSSVAGCDTKSSLSLVEKQLCSTCLFSNGCTTKKLNYENAVETLNTLQSNYSVLQNSIKSKHQDDSRHISDTAKFLDHIGLPLSSLDELRVIHVAGSKGKGSTCAMVESILRHNGYRTGFFSSPHLVAVTERIRLNGVPISNDQFADNFWDIYNRLLEKQDCLNDLPSYFCFLTIMALKVFLSENVDVCVIEVGVGGRYDCTNVLRNTRTVGISSLGLEHTQLLGQTLEEIAWQKAGIIKRGCDVFTTSQTAESLQVIRQECLKLMAALHVIPSRLDEYNWATKPTLMNDMCAAMQLNTSLAIQIAYSWIKRTRPNEIPPNSLLIPRTFAEGIDRCFWPGRLQKIRYGDRRTLYLDGAHTVESIDVCVRWFATKSISYHKKVLIFNTTGARDSSKLLALLSGAVQFDAVFFTPNVASCVAMRADNMNHNFPIEHQLQRCKQNLTFWQTHVSNQNCFLHNSVESVFNQIDKMYTSSLHNYDILITGSIHLLGATLIALDLKRFAYNSK